MSRSRYDRSLPQVFIVSTTFTHTLQLKGLYHGFDDLRTWLSFQQLQNHQIILIPCFRSHHWGLVVYYPAVGLVEYLDSMPSHQSDPHYTSQAHQIGDYIHMLHRHHNSSTQLNIQIRRDLPHQTNAVDCGVFLMMFAEYTSRGAAITFQQRDINTLRLKIAYELINNTLVREVQIAHHPPPPGFNFTSPSYNTPPPALTTQTTAKSNTTAPASITKSPTGTSITSKGNLVTATTATHFTESPASFNSTSSPPLYSIPPPGVATVPTVVDTKTSHETATHTSPKSTPSPVLYSTPPPIIADGTTVIGNTTQLRGYQTPSHSTSLSTPPPLYTDSNTGTATTPLCTGYQKPSDFRTPPPSFTTSSSTTSKTSTTPPNQWTPVSRRNSYSAKSKYTPSPIQLTNRFDILNSVPELTVTKPTAHNYNLRSTAKKPNKGHNRKKHSSQPATSLQSKYSNKKRHSSQQSRYYLRSSQNHSSPIQIHMSESGQTLEPASASKIGEAPHSPNTTLESVEETIPYVNPKRHTSPTAQSFTQVLDSNPDPNISFSTNVSDFQNTFCRLISLEKKMGFISMQYI